MLGHSTEASTSVEMPDIREIAQYFDATRSAVQTVLAELEKKRLVALSGDRITVLNRKGLEDILK